MPSVIIRGVRLDTDSDVRPVISPIAKNAM